jgi:hypothetical protein
MRNLLADLLTLGSAPTLRRELTVTALGAVVLGAIWLAAPDVGLVCTAFLVPYLVVRLALTFVGSRRRARAPRA